MEAKLNPLNLTLTNPDHWRKNYYQYLFNYAAAKIADRSAIDDLIQEVFLIALESRTHFKGQSTERTWLTGILKNTIFVYCRRQKAFRTVFINLDEELLNNIDVDPQCAPALFAIYNHFDDQVGKMFTEMELKRMVHRGIVRLPCIWRSVFVMKYIEEQPVSVICRELNLSHSNYWMICHRARTSVKTFVEKELKRRYA
jgi:RNA polymerase sigma factor (sigma-70 family)